MIININSHCNSKWCLCLVVNSLPLFLPHHSHALCIIYLERIISLALHCYLHLLSTLRVMLPENRQRFLYFSLQVSWHSFGRCGSLHTQEQSSHIALLPSNSNKAFAHHLRKNTVSQEAGSLYIQLQIKLPHALEPWLSLLQESETRWALPSSMIPNDEGCCCSADAADFCNCQTPADFGS